MAGDYGFSRIDRSNVQGLALQATRYKTLRLQALLQSAAAFSSTHEIESQFSDSVWLSRLNDPSKETFVCEIDGEWVAQVTLRGPISSHNFRLPRESGQSVPKPDEEEVKWQMLSLYTLPGHRGKGLGKRLCRESFRWLKERYEMQEKKVLVRIMVKPDNALVIRMYEALGFERTGTCTLEEALRANGDEELLPKGALPERFMKRSGVVMAINL